MLRIRVITAGAMVLMMAGAAAAQSAAAQSDDVSGTAAPGKPVSLLQILLKPASSQPAQDDPAVQAESEPAQAQPAEHNGYRKVAHRHRSARKYVHRKAHDEDTAAAPPASDTAAPTVAPASDATANTQAAPDQSNMSALVVDGHTVQVASPDQVNMMDMAAGETPAADPQPALAAPAQDITAAQPSDAVAVPAPAQDQPAALDQTPETAPAVVATESVVQQDDGSNNSNSRDLWYEKLLATLSGAFVAASVAWLLIGSAPPRRDSREPMLTYETERMTR